MCRILLTYSGRSPFSYNESALSMTYKPGSNSTQKPFYPFATAQDGFSPLPAPPPFGPRLSRVLGRPALAAGSDLPIYSQLQIEIGFLGMRVRSIMPSPSEPG